ncbi:MAG: glycosyltransferase, partial [Gammaproteobacteria bacterium]|nr:glycosyltransferase [Gammaproteobacteria bacterium]
HPCQIVVIDDGSDEPIKDIVEATCLRCHHRGWKFCRQENEGVAGALNMGIEISDGDYIQWLPSDDLFMADKTARQLEAIDNHRVCYTGYELGIPKPQATYLAAQYPTQEVFFNQLKQHCFINAATVMWSRSVFEDIGVFDPRIIHAQDYEFLLRCASKWNFQVVAEPMVRRRVHAGQMINTLRDEVEAEKKRQDMRYLRDTYGAVGGVWTPEGTESL